MAGSILVNVPIMATSTGITQAGAINSAGSQGINLQPSITLRDTTTVSATGFLSNSDLASTSVGAVGLNAQNSGRITGETGVNVNITVTSNRPYGVYANRQPNNNVFADNGIINLSGTTNILTISQANPDVANAANPNGARGLAA